MIPGFKFRRKNLVDRKWRLMNNQTSFLSHLKNCPILFIYFFTFQTIVSKNCRLRWESNTDRLIGRLSSWPLDHHLDQNDFTTCRLIATVYIKNNFIVSQLFYKVNLFIAMLIDRSFSYNLNGPWYNVINNF